MDTTIFSPASLAEVLMLRLVNDAARSSTITASTEVGAVKREGRMTGEVAARLVIAVDFMMRLNLRGRTVRVNPLSPRTRAV